MTGGLGLAACAALGAVFAWAGAVKTLQTERWRRDLRVYRLSRPLRALALFVLPPVEVGVAGLLLTGGARPGGALTVALTAVFCAAIVRARLLQSGNALPCGCFGRISARDYRVHLARNLLIGALAAAVLAWADRPLISARLQPVLLAAVALAAVCNVAVELGSRLRRRSAEDGRRSALEQVAPR